VLLRGHHTRRRSSAALPIAPIVLANWYGTTRIGILDGNLRIVVADAMPLFNPVSTRQQ